MGQRSEHSAWKHLIIAGHPSNAIAKKLLFCVSGFILPEVFMVFTVTPGES